MNKMNKAQRIAAVIVAGINNATLNMATLKLTPSLVAGAWACDKRTAQEALWILRDNHGVSI